MSSVQSSKKNTRYQSVTNEIMFDQLEKTIKGRPKTDKELQENRYIIDKRTPKKNKG